jgi:hypothetical protein
MTGVVHAAGKVGVDPYARIDAISEEVSRSPAAFSGLLASEPRIVGGGSWAALEEEALSGLAADLVAARGPSATDSRTIASRCSTICPTNSAGAPRSTRGGNRSARPSLSNGPGSGWDGSGDAVSGSL